MPVKNISPLGDNGCALLWTKTDSIRLQEKLKDIETRNPLILTLNQIVIKK